MPKLVIQIDHEFRTAPFIAHDEKSSEVRPLSEKALNKLLAVAEPKDFSLSVMLMDPVEGEPSISFELPVPNLKKGGIFDWKIDTKERTAVVRVVGELSTNALRSGVAPEIQKVGTDVRFCLDAFNFKGGYWSGFQGSVEGQSDKNYKDWFKVENWKLK